ncbi:phosphoribosyltransferase-like protein [Insolitispirillum peregrinum]|uniref:PRTase-CE domain-containing protein n=1 Tax=Insolitispirillum peregrinum TaxID=80876 RepID=A0A1N7IHT8_9PROT|nr:hypothetical protein [Insolitispirillum peregrinum]SIS36669.1 hypothetical protein SAMN05421779_10187 [Insolitispirillum peregrinum]
MPVAAIAAESEDDIADSIADKIKDYREGEIDVPTGEHVRRWAGQFDPLVQRSILVETRHFLEKRYISKGIAENFISGLSRNSNLAGRNPATFWAGVGFLRLQERSQSQCDMLAILSDVLCNAFGVTCARQTAANGVYVYIDDAIFSGRQVLDDLRRWINGWDISDCTVHVICIGSHKSGRWYAARELGRIAGLRQIDIRWWFDAEIEDWRKEGNGEKVDVLWPTYPPGKWCLSKNKGVYQYVPSDQYVNNWWTKCPDDAKKFNPRPPFNGERNLGFESEAGRGILEQAFLQRGAYICSLSENPNKNMHPLGYHKLNGPGCGTLLTTYRNCPNNAPLVLWWGDQDASYPLNQWYPLMPRRTRTANRVDDLPEENAF